MRAPIDPQTRVLPPPASALQLLDRAFGILALFNAESPTWSLSEVSRSMRLKTTTTHRILQVLHQHGYLGRDETTRRYHLGMAALDLGVRARRAIQDQEGTVTALRWLASFTGETAFLTVPSRDRLYSVCMQRAEASDPLRLTIEIGRRLPIHAGAGQKVLLAFMPPEDQELVLRRPLEQIASKTIVDPDRLRADLESIAAQGWSMSFEESHDGTWGVSVALLQPTGNIAACVGVAGPLSRYTQRRGESCLREVWRAAKSIAEELGVREFETGAESRAKPREGSVKNSLI
jgi:DNA-binding IclR family transcriptional regulator